MSPPIYYGGDRLSLSGIDKVYYGSDLVYSQNEGPDYLKFTATQNGSTVGIVNTSNQPDIQVNVNGTGWEDWGYSTIRLDNGEWVEMRGDNPLGFSRVFSQYSTFSSNGRINISGNIMTLIDMTGETDTIPEAVAGWGYCFGSLFKNSTHIVDCSQLSLSATNLSPNCYSSMFDGCTALTAPPQLPATTLASGCYSSMFDGCTALTAPPQLPATTLASGCYSSMFRGCRSMTVAPQLPATTLASGCYSSMFRGCSSLRVVSGDQETVFLRMPSSFPSGAVSQMLEGTGGLTTTDPMAGVPYGYY